MSFADFLILKLAFYKTKESDLIIKLSICYIFYQMLMLITDALDNELTEVPLSNSWLCLMTLNN